MCVASYTLETRSQIAAVSAAKSGLRFRAKPCAPFCSILAAFTAGRERTPRRVVPMHWTQVSITRLSFSTGAEITTAFAAMLRRWTIAIPLSPLFSATTGHIARRVKRPLRVATMDGTRELITRLHLDGRSKRGTVASVVLWNGIVA